MNMKKITLIITLLFCTVSVVLNAKATVCYSNGVCSEVSRIKINGVWHEACCNNIAVAAGASCTDDCN